MTVKKRTEPEFLPGGVVPAQVEVEVAAGEEVLPVAAPVPVSLHGLTAAEALAKLRELHAAGKPVVVDAPEGRPRDSVVVDAHHFAGEQVGRAWHFHPISLDMACRLAGWSTVERDGARWRLS